MEHTTSTRKRKRAHTHARSHSFARLFVCCGGQLTKWSFPILCVIYYVCTNIQCWSILAPNICKRLNNSPSVAQKSIVQVLELNSVRSCLWGFFLLAYSHFRVQRKMNKNESEPKVLGTNKTIEIHYIKSIWQLMNKWTHIDAQCVDNLVFGNIIFSSSVVCCMYGVHVNVRCC